MASIVSQRFVQCHLQLKEEGRIRSSRQFALALDYHPQNLSEIVKGKRDVPLDVIRRAYETFGINPIYLYTGQGDMFVHENEASVLKTLTVVQNQEGEECIVHIPIPAQAGYCQQQYVDPDFFSGLPTYRMPGVPQNQGQLRSFDIQGDSMMPFLKEGDVVICSYLSPHDWNHSIADNHVYVIVTQSGLMVKRIENHLERHRHLMLRSDNAAYKDYRLNVSEIREIWKVRHLISKFDHQRVAPDSLNETISQQSALITKLTYQIEKLTEIYDH